jgi:putative transposase
VSVVRFIADQRTNYRVPLTATCALLGVSISWFYKWIHRTPTPTEQRRAEIDAAAARAFDAAHGLHGSPRLHADLREAGWVVSEKTIAGSMRRQGLIARRIRRRNRLTRQDKTAPKFPDLLKRDFTASEPNCK